MCCRHRGKRLRTGTTAAKPSLHFSARTTESSPRSGDASPSAGSTSAADLSTSSVSSRNKVSVVLVPSGASTPRSASASNTSGGMRSPVAESGLKRGVRLFIQAFERKLDGLEPVPLELQKALLRMWSIVRRRRAATC